VPIPMSRPRGAGSHVHIQTDQGRPALQPIRGERRGERCAQTEHTIPGARRRRASGAFVAALTAAAVAAAIGVLAMPGVSRDVITQSVLRGTSFSSRSASAQGDDLAEAWSLVDTWEGTGQSAPGSVLYPRGAQLVGDTLWLVDAGNARVQGFGTDGAFKRTFGRQGEGPGMLSDPRDLDTGPEGLLYVSDTGNSRVAIFEPATGDWRGAWSHPDLVAPWGVAASSEQVYISQPSTGEIFVFDSSGDLVQRWGGLGAPRGLSLDVTGNLWVADEGAGATVSLDGSGRQVMLRSERHAPLDIEVDERGDQYVMSSGAVLWYESGADRSLLAMFYQDLQGLALGPAFGVLATVASDTRGYHGAVVWRWRPRDGEPIAYWPILGYPPGRLNSPSTIHSAPDGRIWVGDAWPRLQAFASDGSVVEQLLLPGVPRDLVVTTGDELVVAERSKLVRMSSTRDIVATLPLRRGGRDYWVTGMGLAPDETRVTLSDAANGMARTFGITTTMAPVEEIELFDASSEAWQLHWDVAYDPSAAPGTVRWYVVNRSRGRLERYEDGRPAGTLDVEGIPARADVDPDGNIFVLTVEGIIWKLTPTGEVQAGWDAARYSAGGSSVLDIAIGDDGRVYTADAASNSIRVWQLDPDGDPERPIARSGACRVAGDKRAAPNSIKIGSAVTVTLEVGGECPDTAPRSDIVLAIDRSGSMNQANGITATREAALAFLDLVDFSEDRLSVVAFNNTAQLIVPLTDDTTAARAAIGGLTAIGGTDLAAAIDTSAAELFGPRGRTDAKPLIILLSDGRPDDDAGRSAALEAASRAKARGARIFMIGFGDIDPMIMALSASSPEDAYFAADPSTLADIYSDIASRIAASVLLRSLEVVDELPDDMLYLGHTEGPAPARRGRTLTWTLTDVPFDGLILTYRLEPQALGLRPTNVEARGTFEDGMRRGGRLVFPVPKVEVLSLDPTATPTLTPFPTRTPTPTGPFYAHLPIAARQRCLDADIGADVVVVLDNSGSMNEPARPGAAESKMEAAVTAALVLVERMRDVDRIAVVTFDEDAELVQPLSGDRALIEAALRSITTGAGTRIDRGLRAAIDELMGERRIEGNTRAIALLTDGRSSVESEVVLTRAEEARAESDRLFVIGLGGADELDFDLLEAVAGRTDDFHVAPDAAQLEAIYAAIALSLECANLRWP